MTFMPGRQAELGDAPQDQRLVGGLLGVLAEDDDPAGVERAVDVVVPAVHVQRVLGERARGNLQHHRRALAGRVVILLDAVDDALARRVVDDAFAAHGVRDRAALGRVLAFGLDGNRVVAEDVEFALGERLLVQLAAFGRRRDGIEDTGVGNARFGVVGNQLVAVGGDADSRITRSLFHRTPLRARSGARPGQGDCEKLRTSIRRTYTPDFSLDMPVPRLFDLNIEHINGGHPTRFPAVGNIQGRMVRGASVRRCGGASEVRRSGVRGCGVHDRRSVARTSAREHPIGASVRDHWTGRRLTCVR